MSDRDYGCNAKDPEGIIAVILDDAERAKEILKELDGLGFAIVPKEPTIQMKQAGVVAWRREYPNQVYAEPLAEACYRAMLDTAAPR